MQEGKPSVTAMGVALHRAAHQLLDHPPVFVDPMAMAIVTPRARRALELNPRYFERRIFAGALRAHLAARSRLAEDSLAAAVAKGVRQYVVLGAGLDTFSLRNTNPNLRVFEVDFPSTQAWKRERIAESGAAVSPTTTFVPVDFERQQLGAQLAAAGFDDKAGAFFSWLGVVPYLESAAIWETLRYVASVASRHGGVVFDYSIPAGRNPLRQLLLWLFTRRVARVGEPIRSMLDPNDVVSGLTKLGFTSVHDFDRAALNARYFVGRADGLRLRGPGHFALATND